MDRGVSDGNGLTPFSGTVWRILFAQLADDALLPARAPEGRFHYGGQPSIYTSLTAEGAGVAIQRYLAAGDAPRVIVPLEVAAIRVLDLRRSGDDSAGVPPTSVVWQDQRAQGLRASTWDISDNARHLGAQGILYPSRTRPDLNHLVLFGVPVPGELTQVAPGKSWRSVDQT